MARALVGVSSLVLIVAGTCGGQIRLTQGSHGEPVFVNDDLSRVRPSHLARTHRQGMSARDEPACRLVSDTARRYRLDPRLVAAVIQVESAWNPRAVSPRQAIGLMQLMPATATAYGVQNRFDPAENVRGGTAYLRSLLDRHHGDLLQALQGYYAGPQVAQRAESVRQQAQQYARRVLDRYFGHSSQPAGASSGGIVAVRDRHGELWYTNQ